MPVVSIVVPTYNSHVYAKRLCESILNQTFQDFEVLIVDNSSNDKTIETIKKINNDSRKFRYFSINNNGVIGKSRNLGIKNSLGNYIAFHDSDDFWFKDKLSDTINYFPDYDFVYHNFLIKKEKSINILKRKFNSYQLGQNSFLELVTKGNPISTSSVVCKKKIIYRYKIFESKKLITIEDYDCWINLSKKNIKFKEIKKSLGFYNVGNTNMSFSTKKDYQIFYIFNKYKNF